MRHRNLAMFVNLSHSTFYNMNMYMYRRFPIIYERTGLFSAKYSWLSALMMARAGLLVAREAAALWP